MTRYLKNFSFVLVALAQTQAAITINPNIPGVQGTAQIGPCGWIVNFYNFALLFSGILAFGAIVFGGFLYATSAGNPSRQSEGRSWIESALLGLLLLAGAYAILYTVNPALTSCSLPTLTGIQDSSGGTGSGGVGSTGSGVGQGLSASQAQAQLISAGVTIKSGASVDGLQQSTVSTISQLAAQCAQQSAGATCGVVITAGTDGDHSTLTACNHANGYKADLRPNLSLDAFITKLPRAETRSDGAPLYKFNGGVIADERNLPPIAPHWDLSTSCP